MGSTSTAQTATLTNTGDQAVTISSVVASSPFSQTNNCPSTLATGGSCQIQVVFAPTVPGNLSGAVAVTDNAANSPQTVALQGTGTVLSFSPVAVNFGDQRVGTNSSAAPVTTSNVSAKSVAISSISITGANPQDFSQINNCGAGLAGNSACTVNVKFKPTATGARSAAITFIDNGGGSPQSVALSGTGK